MAFYPGVPNLPETDAIVPYTVGNVRLLTGKVARAIFGPTYSANVSGGAVLDPDQLRDLTADTIAKLIFYTNGLWPYQLTVDDVDSNGMPCEYSITQRNVPTALSISDETLVVAQAGLDWFFFEFKDKKVSEEISDEGQKWAYSLSANLLLAQYKQLIADRDRALDVVTQRADYLVDYVSFVAERDALTSAMVEWWVRPGLTYPSGQEVAMGALGAAAFGG